MNSPLPFRNLFPTFPASASDTGPAPDPASTETGALPQGGPSSGSDRSPGAINVFAEPPLASSSSGADGEDGDGGDATDSSSGGSGSSGGGASRPGAPSDFFMTYEAEAARLSGGLATESSVPGASGGAYVALEPGPDAFDLAADFFDDLALGDPVEENAITFEMEAPEDGWYTFDFRYSNTTGETLYADLRIDGEDVPGVLVFEDVFAADDWSSTTDRVYLEAGDHDITLSSTLDEDEPASVSGNEGTLLVDSMSVSGGVAPSDHISARSLLMNNMADMVAIHESAQEDPEDTSIFGPELSQLRHAANWSQNQIESGQLWIRGTADDGAPAYYGPQFDSSLYFDERGIMNVDYGNYLPTDEELPVRIEKDYAMVPGQPLLVERYTLENNEPLGSGLLEWEIMNRLHLPENLMQKAVWDERRETFIVELDQADQDAPLYMAFGAFQEMDGGQAITPEVVDKTPTQLPEPGAEADLLDPSPLADEPQIANAFYSDGGLPDDITGAGEGLSLAMATNVELYATRPVQYYFYYTLAEDLETLDAQVDQALNPNDQTILNSPDFWFSYTEQIWEDKLGQAVDPAAGGRPIEDEALLTAYDRTLTTILQSQQPEFGSFVAATNPSYDFKVWPRDSAVTAMGLDAAGLVDDAEQYWKWMASVEEDGDGDPLFENGTFYTNYSYWDANQPIDFVQPEWDAQGLFLIGVLKHVETLDAMGMSDRADAFLADEVVRNALIDSAEFIASNIGENGFGPAEFSIWESFFAYNGFTQITYASGLTAAAQLADRLGVGDRASDWIDGAQTIKAAIERPMDDPDFPGLWNEADGYFIWGVTPDGDPIERPNAALDLMWVTGLFDVDDPKVQSQMDYVLDNLSNNTWGISRYDSDNFYAQSPFSPGGSYESNVDEPSWPQMTSYMGMGKEFAGDLDWAYNSLEWTVSRYAEGFMPPGEGVDPSTREPLPSTMVEPVTGAWYMLNLLNYTEQFDPRLDGNGDGGGGNGGGDGSGGAGGGGNGSGGNGDGNLTPEELVELYEPQSMLYQARQYTDLVDGSSAQWNGPYMTPEPDEFRDAAGELLTIYPRSILPEEGESVFGTLADEDLWDALSEIGITLMHPIAFEQAGQVVGDELSSSIDGGFDRISMQIEPLMGTEEDVRDLAQTAAAHDALVAGDIIPLHTGLGYDFRLATMAYDAYPGVYDMVEVPEEMWDLLPEVEDEWGFEVLTNDEIDPFIDAGVVPGRMEVLLGAEESVDWSGWAATGEVEGVDGTDRRWLYGHLFKPEQPLINWMDPTYNGRLTQSGDITRHIDMGVPIDRLDATPFIGLGVPEDSDTLQTYTTQLAIQGTNDLAFTHRKLDGWTWVELNVPADQYQPYLEHGPDMGYDFVTRAQTLHPLIDGDARVLRIAHQNLLDSEVDHSRLIHALQNHDEIAYQLIPLRSQDEVQYGDETLSGSELADRILAEAQQAAAGENAPYNALYRPAENGIATTYLGYIAPVLGIDPYEATPDEVDTLEQAHALLAQVSAMQPGAFALSQWDLVGALPLDRSLIEDRLEEGDLRWINRGAVDLMDDSDASESPFGLPEAQTLYAPLDEQLEDPESFASQVGDIIEARKAFGIADAEVVAVPDMEDVGLFALVMELPDEVGGVAVTVANYGQEEAAGTVDLSALDGLPDLSGASASSIVEGQTFAGSFDGAALSVSLDALSARTIVIGGEAMQVEVAARELPEIPGEVELEPIPFETADTETAMAPAPAGASEAPDAGRMFSFTEAFGNGAFDLVAVEDFDPETDLIDLMGEDLLMSLKVPTGVLLSAGPDGDLILLEDVAAVDSVSFQSDMGDDAFAMI